jgi:hypothetical protein
MVDKDSWDEDNPFKNIKMPPEVIAIIQEGLAGMREARMPRSTMHLSFEATLEEASEIAALLMKMRSEVKK